MSLDGFASVSVGFYWVLGEVEANQSTKRERRTNASRRPSVQRLRSYRTGRRASLLETASRFSLLFLRSFLEVFTVDFFSPPKSIAFRRLVVCFVRLFVCLFFSFSARVVKEERPSEPRNARGGRFVALAVENLVGGAVGCCSSLSCLGWCDEYAISRPRAAATHSPGHVRRVSCLIFLGCHVWSVQGVTQYGTPSSSTTTGCGIGRARPDIGKSTTTTTTTKEPRHLAKKI